MPPISGPSIGRQTRLANTFKANSEALHLKQAKLNSGLPTEPLTSSVGGTQLKKSSQVFVHDNDNEGATSEVVEVKHEALKHKKAKLIYQMKLDELQKKLELQISVERSVTISMFVCCKKKTCTIVHAYYRARVPQCTCTISHAYLTAGVP